jgi:hypothetical protein
VGNIQRYSGEIIIDCTGSGFDAKTGYTVRRFEYDRSGELSVVRVRLKVHVGQYYAIWPVRASPF